MTGPMKQELTEALALVREVYRECAAEYDFSPSEKHHAALATITEALGELDARQKAAEGAAMLCMACAVPCIVQPALTSEEHADLQQLLNEPARVIPELSALLKERRERAAAAPVAEPREIRVGSVWRYNEDSTVHKVTAIAQRRHAPIALGQRWNVDIDYMHESFTWVSDPDPATDPKEK